MAEWLTGFNEGVCQNKRILFWCLVVLSPDSFIKAALVWWWLWSLFFSYLIYSDSSFFKTFFMKSIHQGSFGKSKAQLWSWYSLSVIKKEEKKDCTSFWDIRPSPIWALLMIGHLKVLDPACPAICFSTPNEACLSLRSSETPPPHWPNQPQKKLWPLWWHSQAKSQSRLVISSTPGT